jgi:hypothetical protein
MSCCGSHGNEKEPKEEEDANIDATGHENHRDGLQPTVQSTRHQDSHKSCGCGGGGSWMFMLMAGVLLGFLVLDYLLR